MSEPEDKTEDEEAQAERDLEMRIEAGDFDHIFFSSADWTDPE